MLTKEEIIILRTILLEFEDAEDRQKRLLIPYENVARVSDRIESAVKARGLTEVLDVISNTYGGDFWFDILSNNTSTQSLDDPELFIPDELVFYSGDYRYNEPYVLHDDENEEKKFLEDFYILSKRSNSDFFINLRWGLYYKCLGRHEDAIKYFEVSDQAYHKMIQDSVDEAVKRLNNILTQIYDLDKKILKEPYTPEKHGSFKIWPPEIFASIEELPTFHIGEIFLEKGNKCFEGYKQSRDICVLKDAAEHYSRALTYFDETERWYYTLFHGQENEDKSLSGLLKHLNILRKFEIFPVIPFQRNSYLEINIFTVKNKLQRIDQERLVSTLTPLDTDFVEKLKEKIAKEFSGKYEREIKRYEIEVEMYKKLISPLQGNKNNLLFIIKQARESIFWFDQHFPSDGFDLLKEVIGKIGLIRILTTVKADRLNELHERFKKFKQEMKTDGTRIEIRVTCNDKILRNLPHARFLIIDNQIYNVPHLTAILAGKYDEIKPTLQMPPIEEPWSQSKDIIEHWKIIKNEFERRTRR